MGYFKILLTGQLVVVVSGICHVEVLLIPVSVRTSYTPTRDDSTTAVAL